jgi:hypothetical protein
MTTSIKHEEYTHNGRRVILDAAELCPGIYEIMLLRSDDGYELEAVITGTATEALEAFDKIRAAHLPDSEQPDKIPAPLTGKYAKLRDDLKKALEAGRAAEDADPEDGGTCNLDAASILLPRWSASKVEQAAKEAGTGCFTWSLFRQKRYVFRPNTYAQGNARSRNAEAMTAALRSMGYDAFDYAQMD